MQVAKAGGWGLGTGWVTLCSMQGGNSPWHVCINFIINYLVIKEKTRES
jgi:hypothetical protein